MFVCGSREKIEVRKRNSEESRCKVDSKNGKNRGYTREDDGRPL
jgi:hypothetical protein